MCVFERLFDILQGLYVFTKIKSLCSVHRLMQYCDMGAKIALSKCLKSLRKEYDSKTDANFFDENYQQKKFKMMSNCQATEAIL